MNITKIWGFLFIFSSLAASASTNFGLSFLNYQRLNEPHNTQAGTDWFEIQVSSHQEEGSWKGEVQMDGRLSPSNKHFLYSIGQMNLEYTGEKTTVWVGRKVLDWNFSEKFWGMNNINPQRAFSLVETEQEGLVAMCIKSEYKGIKIEGLFSPFYLPQMNPDYDIGQPGKILTKSEWLKPPPTSVVYNNVSTPVNYEVEKPDVVDVVLQESIALNLGYHWDSGALSFYGLHKPENKIRINATGRYDLDDHIAHVRAKPFVNYHNVYGGNFWQNVGLFSFGAGVEVDNPVKGDDPTFIFDIADFKPVYIERTFLHGFLKFKNRSLEIASYYIELVKEAGAKPDEFFSEKASWSRAAGVKFLYNLSDKLSYLLHFRHDFKWSDTVTRNEVDYRFSNFAGISLGAEFIESPQDNSYWSYFRSNDKFYSSFYLYF